MPWGSCRLDVESRGSPPPCPTTLSRRRQAPGGSPQALPLTWMRACAIYVVRIILPATSNPLRQKDRPADQVRRAGSRPRRRWQCRWCAATGSEPGLWSSRRLPKHGIFGAMMSVPHHFSETQKSYPCSDSSDGARVPMEKWERERERERFSNTKQL